MKTSDLQCFFGLFGGFLFVPYSCVPVQGGWGAGACELRLMWLKDRLCVVSVFAEVPDGPSQFVGKQM